MAIGLHHHSFSTYHLTVASSALSNTYLGLQPSSLRAFIESRLYLTSWPGLSLTSSIRLSSLPITLRIMPLTVEDIMEAAKLMKGYSLDYEDAIHLATVLRSRAKEIISNDEDFDRTPLKRAFG